MKCRIPECDRGVKETEYCTKHRQRITKTGSPYRLCKDCRVPLPEDENRNRRCEDCQAENVCPIDECGRPSAGWGMCKMHWKRWKKHGDPTIKTTYKQIKGDCLVEGCVNPYHANGYCASHEYFNRRYGNPLAQGVGRYHGRNRMDVPSYAGIHKRIFYDRGRARQFKCVDCGNDAQEWSYDGGAEQEYWQKVRGVYMAYSVDQSLYSPRCKPCHRGKDLDIQAQYDRAVRLGRYFKESLDGATAVHIDFKEI